MKASFLLRIESHYQDAMPHAEQVLSPVDGGSGVYNYHLRENYAEVFIPAFNTLVFQPDTEVRYRAALT